MTKSHVFIKKKKTIKDKTQKQWNQKTNSKPKVIDFILIIKNTETVQQPCTFMTEQQVNEIYKIFYINNIKYSSQ